MDEIAEGKQRGGMLVITSPIYDKHVIALVWHIDEIVLGGAVENLSSIVLQQRHRRFPWPTYPPRLAAQREIDQ